VADKKTQAEEKSSLLIFEEVLTKNKDYKSWQDIRNDDEVYKKIKKEFKKANYLDKFGEVPTSWLKSYYKQQAKILQKYKSAQFDLFKYQGRWDFIKFLRGILKKYPEARGYEQWNPADIWIIKKPYSDITNLIKKETSGESQTIEELNEVLRSLFKQKRIVGISLKKISGKVALYELVNVNPKFFDADRKRNHNFKIDDIVLKLNIVNGKFESTDLVVKLENNTKSTIKNYKFQIRQNVSSSTRINFSNLKFEGSGSGSAARGGKAEVKKVANLMKSKKLKFENDYSNYPMSEDQFDKNSTKYLNIFSELKKKQVIENYYTKDQFTEDIKYAFRNFPDAANSKLMQMDFINQILTLSPDDQIEFWTDVFFLSIKKGPGFGPHGKLY
jgi:hypothetical protein